MMMPYYIVKINLNSNKEMPLYEYPGKILYFKTGRSAKEFLNVYKTSFNCDTKFKIRQEAVPEGSLESKRWRKREQARLNFKKYEQLPDFIPVINKDHYTHIDPKDRRLVRFTMNTADGIADRKTRMSVGRYCRNYSTVSPDAIATISAQYAAWLAPSKLMFAKTAREIQDVYMRGPPSCMSQPIEAYGGHSRHNFFPKDTKIHPTAPYGDSDLQVAYIYLADKQRIVARSVVWPEQKIYSTIYGNAEALQPALKAAGYQYGTLDGARIRAISVGKYRIAMPYVDSCAGGTLSPCKNYIILGEDSGDIRTRVTEGFTYLLGFKEHQVCQYLNARVHLPSDAFVPIADLDGALWSIIGLDLAAFKCQCTGHYYSRSTEYVIMANGDIWSYAAYSKGGYRFVDSKRYAIAQSTYVSGILYPNEYLEKHGIPETSQSIPKPIIIGSETLQDLSIDF